MSAGALFSGQPLGSSILVVFISRIQIVFELSCKLFSSQNTHCLGSRITRFLLLLYVLTSTLRLHLTIILGIFGWAHNVMVLYNLLCCNFVESLGHKQFMFSSSKKNHLRKFLMMSVLFI